MAKERALTFVADFETTTDPEDCRVWGWGIANIQYPEEVDIDHTLEQFIDRISFQNGICYFHNLRFDGHFIIDWLLKNEFILNNDVSMGMIPGEFRTLISDMGKFYSIKVKWFNGNSTEFRDSYKKLPMSVKNIAKSFGMDEGKGEIDYEKVRPLGYRMTREEADYIRRDVKIVAEAIKEVIDNGMTKLTIASDALAEYKRVITPKRFQSLFPVFDSVMDAEIRKAYRGGFAYADPRTSKKKLGGGIVLDVNSLYPSVMYNELIPFGEPEYMEGRVTVDQIRPLAIFGVTFTAKLKPDHIPCIQIKGTSAFVATEYLREIDEPTTLVVTNVDWDLYNDHYDIEVQEYIGGWRFRAMRGMFDEYIDKWSTIKANSEGGKREIAKLHLNSLYGRFATNPNVTGKYPVLKDGIVKYVTGPEEFRPPIYTAAGVFITSHARNLTIRAAQANYKYFAYADTDSLHLLTDTIPETIDVHPTRMGAWKLEYGFDEAFYIRPKAYIERMVWKHDKEGNRIDVEPESIVRIAGLPDNVKHGLTIADLKDGRVFHGKLVPRAVRGGVVLTDTPFELRL